ncbi:SLC13 family permease [Amycolatopsis rhabdoformis]|uniref:SLC13 family permease n=1 Tax=Amycolatopsis rhabdoformis TaxID=1448059 RepID=A0ABZ1I685_9PSEU|nr:SLC13 family permease [Amycolatopsis rhabdoformis]WSE29862.1 SLC13 family permease [Amycolatopsis rhabdoformis]
MLVHLIGLAVFVLMFVLSALRSVSMGILGFAAAFVVGLTVVHQSAATTIAGFPVDLLVIVVGVTLLFGIAQANGTVQLLVDASVRLIRGRVALLPWLLFALSAILCGIGALGPAVISILFPVGMAFAATHGIRPTLIATMVGFGAVAGGFAPLGIYGIIVKQALKNEAIAVDSRQLALVVFLAALLAGVIAYLTAGGLQLRRVRCEVDKTKLGTTLEQKCTVVALVALVTGAVGFDLDIGLLAISLAAVLGLVFSASLVKAQHHISWNVVLLLGGVITYVGVLDKAGTIDWLGQRAGGIGSPLLAALVICYIAGAVSAFASTTGMLGALVPLCVPLLRTGGIEVLGFAAALSLSAALVDTSPFSTVGAVAIASAPEEQRPATYRSLLRVGFTLVVLAPLLSWAVLVAPRWL